MTRLLRKHWPFCSFVPTHRSATNLNGTCARPERRAAKYRAWSMFTRVEFSFGKPQFAVAHVRPHLLSDSKMLHHLALRTNSPAELAAFYLRVCGLTVWSNTPANASGIWLGAGSTVVMIETRSPTEPGPAREGMDLLAFQAQQTDINAVLAFLAEQAVAVESSTAFTAYFRDPDGRRVALSTYMFPAQGNAVPSR